MVVGDVGGGFGMKTGIYPEDVVVAYAARALRRPVKWTADRSEEFLSASHGRDVRSRAELALDADGKILALRVHSLANVGAYATPAGVADPAADRPVGLDQHLRHPDDRPALQGGADQHRADRRRTAAPAGRRRSTSSSG